MTDNFNVSWPVNWLNVARKQTFIPKRLDSMFACALVPGWRPFVNKVYDSGILVTFYSRAINLLSTRLACHRTGGIPALEFFSKDEDAFGSH